jgi:RNA polymerase sigma-70 factor (ECF subfamily)
VTVDGSGEGAVGRAAERSVGTDAPDSDAALVQRLAAGAREEALAELYRRYGARLYSLGVRQLGDRQLAEELVQETFIRLWRSASAYDPEKGSVAAYVFTIARRIAVDLWRRPSSRPFEPEPEETPDTRDPVSTMLTGLVVRDALQMISPQHREVLELSYRGELSQREIADVLGIPLGTVKTRTYYALRALKLALSERGLDG